MSGCIGGKNYKHRNLLHTTNYVLTRLFCPYITRCMLGKLFMQVQGWREHNRCVHCNGPKSLATCVTWTNKSSLVSISLTKDQNHFELKPRNILTPMKTQWEFLIIIMLCLTENCAAIEYMYSPMSGVGSNIKNRLPKWMDWEVSITVVHNMNNIVKSIKLNQ